MDWIVLRSPGWTTPFWIRPIAWIKLERPVRFNPPAKARTSAIENPNRFTGGTAWSCACKRPSCVSNDCTDVAKAVSSEGLPHSPGRNSAVATTSVSPIHCLAIIEASSQAGSHRPSHAATPSVCNVVSTSATSARPPNAYEFTNASWVDADPVPRKMAMLRRASTRVKRV